MSGIVIRNYQQRAIDALYAYWTTHGFDRVPLLVLPTGAGKSIVLAELVRLMWDTWGEDKPRTVVLVPSKELAEQNVDKLRRIMPSHRSVGVYSASLGRRDLHSDVIVATIGSIYRDAHMLGNIRCVLIDEAHLVNPHGIGRYRKFLGDLSRVCDIAVAGLTATPFRGDGVWLTDGADPLFHGIACEVKLGELLEAGHLAPLVRPVDVGAHIDTSGISTTGGDYKLDDLTERVEKYLPAVAEDAATLAAGRRKWIAFTPAVANAQSLARLLRTHGVNAEVVTGETDKKEREQRIADFRAGRVRCLVTVLALATGFDVPDVDCVIWCRPTRSPVLYVQGAGRGLRAAAGKTDCLWLDYSDTTERMGPIDRIRGRKKRKSTNAGAPYTICDECGAHVVPASALVCPECGAQLREEEDELARAVSNAAILSSQVTAKIVTHPVTDVRYSRHQKPGAPDSMRVDYYNGLRRVASEWVCFEHHGFARAKAEAWWDKRTRDGVGNYSHEVLYGIRYPASIDEAIEAARGHSSHLDYSSMSCSYYQFAVPAAITVNESGRWPEIVAFTWNDHEQNRNDAAEDRAPTPARAA